jgi:predicted XRE-type DNA-binding protein
MRKMSRRNKTEIEFEIGSSNIFVDLGLDEANELYTRAALGVQVMKILKERSYSQKQAAEFLGVKQPEVSAIMRAKFSRFSQKRLIGFLNKLNQKVTIEVSRHRKGEPYQRVTIAA